MEDIVRSPDIRKCKAEDVRDDDLIQIMDQNGSCIIARVRGIDLYFHRQGGDIKAVEFHCEEFGRDDPQRFKTKMKAYEEVWVSSHQSRELQVVSAGFVPLF